MTIVERFDFSEKDLVMLLFFGALFIIMLIMWAIEDGLAWYKENKEMVDIDAEFIAKVLLIPLLFVKLRVAGLSEPATKRRINIFLYT